VTAYFALPESKHPREFYTNQLQFFACVDVYVHAFMDPASARVFQQLRQQNGLAHRTHIEIIPDLFQTMAFTRYGGQSFWEHQFFLDPERLIHKSYWLYVLWVMKSELLAQVADKNLFGSTYFV
jgi:hypothetical protein